MAMDKYERIVIIGAGVFGLSTALRLIEEGYTSVTVLDRSVAPVPDGASNDISRMIRFDYGDKTYAEIAKEAFDLWKTPVYRDAFHQTPTLWVTQDATPEQPVQQGGVEYSLKTQQNLTAMGQEWHPVRGEEAKKRFPAFTGKMDSPGFDAFYNTSTGWADAGLAIRQLVNRCVSSGVSLIAGPSGQVEEFVKKPDGTVRAVRTVNRNRVSGDRFIVATGAWTASLIPSWNSMLASAHPVGYLRLTRDEIAQLRDLPMYFNLSTGFSCFPPHEATGYLKMAIHGYGYTRSTSSAVSAPSSLAVASRADFVPEEAVPRLLAGLNDILPQLVSRGFDRVGLCWYNDTPTGDFIFDYHPEYKNLFIATGGSGQ